MSENVKDSSQPRPADSAQPAPSRPTQASKQPRKPFWKRRIAGLMVLCALAVAAYLIVPQIAESASLQQVQQTVDQLRGQLAEASTARAKLAAETSAAKAELKEAVQRAKSAEADVAAHKLKASAAEKFISELSAKVDEINQAKEQIRKELLQTGERAEQAKADAAQAAQRAQDLSNELASTRKTVQQLSEARRTLEAAKASLTAQLQGSEERSTDLRRLVSSLAFGEPAQPEKPSLWPLEKPITQMDLVAWIGEPTVAFEKGRETEIKWGDQHTAAVVDGVASQIDGRMATWSLLTSLAAYHPSPMSPPAEWRVARGGKLHFADLVSMFGQPERVAGTGNQFTAWWTIGAWARKASATVAEGVVTEFAGKPVNPELCCELVRHRAQAYKTPSEAVQAEATPLPSSTSGRANSSALSWPRRLSASAATE